MEIRFRCGSCGASVKVDARHAGKKAKCPKCAAAVEIPSAEAIRAAQERQASRAKGPAPPPPKASVPPPPPPPPPKAAQDEFAGLSDFAPRFDDDDFDVEPAAAAVAPPPLPPSYTLYRQPETKTLSYAGFWKRFAAAFVDGFIFSVVDRTIEFVARLSFLPANADEQAVASMDAILGLIGLIIWWLYFAVMESSAQQATFGKQAVGIIVVDLKGRRVSFGRASGRTFGKLLSTLTFLIGYIMAAFTPKKQALHDILAGCLVVDR